MASNYTKDDPVFGTIDLDEQYVTDSWLVDQFVGGTLFGWGRNDLGQLGQNHRTNTYSSPIQVGSLNIWKSTLGQQSNLAITTNGALWAWGFNAAGAPALGLNNTTSYSSPVQVGALTNWKQVSCGTFLSVAIKTDGTLWGWGANFSGAIGNGSSGGTSYYSSPVQVGTLTNWKQVTGGGGNINGNLTYALAVKQDGTLWGWGSNQFGQLGNSNITYYSSPIQIGALTNWKCVAANSGYWTMAIKTDGTLWGWGDNRFGQLGINTIATKYYSSPVQVGALSNWKYVTCGGDGATFAIKTDGTLWAWGQNACGELGNNNRTYYSSPIQVGSLTNWKYVAAGGGVGSTDSTNVLAIKTDGTLWAWGYNHQGELGLNNNIYYSSPVQVGSLTNWKYIASGLGVSAAITFADLT